MTGAQPRGEQYGGQKKLLQNDVGHIFAALPQAQNPLLWQFLASKPPPQVISGYTPDCWCLPSGKYTKKLEKINHSGIVLVLGMQTCKFQWPSIATSSCWRCQCKGQCVSSILHIQWIIEEQIIHFKAKRYTLYFITDKQYFW